MASIFDYPPPFGTINYLFQDAFGGGEDTAGELNDGSSVFDYSFECSVCGTAISESDSACGSCGEPIDWDSPPV